MATKKKAERTARKSLRKTGTLTDDLRAHDEDGRRVFRIAAVTTDLDDPVADIEAQLSELFGEPVKVVIGKVVSTDEWFAE